MPYGQKSYATRSVSFPELWAIARYDLRLTDEEFGELTPREFDLLLKRQERQEKKAYARAGIIAAAVINFSLCHPEKPVSPEDFIPGVRTEKEAFDLTKLSPEAQAASYCYSLCRLLQSVDNWKRCGVGSGWAAC